MKQNDFEEKSFLKKMLENEWMQKNFFFKTKKEKSFGEILLKAM